MMTVGGCGRHGQPVRGAAEQLDQLVVDDLHDLLARGEALEDLLPDGLLADALDEGPDDLEVDVGLEEGDAHLAERLLDVLLASGGRRPGGGRKSPRDAASGLRTLDPLGISWGNREKHLRLQDIRGGVKEATGVDPMRRLPARRP